MKYVGRSVEQTERFIKEVVEPLRAIVLTTGDEIVPPGSPLSHGQIYNSNQFTLSALLEQAGAVVVRHQTVRDDPDELRAALQAAGRDVADIGIRSSVGDPNTNVVNKGATTRDIVAAPEGDGQTARVAIQ